MIEDLRIDPERMLRDFDALAGIGSTGDGGVHRPALGRDHLEARAWFGRRVAEAGLRLTIDAAGNHSARLDCATADAPTLLIGSHLDSVPRGGRFDGALGVVAALEVLRTVAGAGLSLSLHLEAIDFTDEEGTLVGLLGSRALAGTLGADDLARPRGGRAALLAGLARAGLREADLVTARRDPATLAGFLELHIEQGPRLQTNGTQIGVVGSIVGIGSLELEFVGRADHAGTTPADERLDAGLGAAAFIVAADERVRRDFAGCVINCGRVQFAPGAHNIVPASATVGVEYRAPHEREMGALRAALLELARSTAASRHLALEPSEQGTCHPTPCDPGVRLAFRSAADRLGLRHAELASGAGHDTMALAAVCPAGMIFIPSSGGSHSPREQAAWPDCVNGANVLLHAAALLAAPAAERS